MVCPGLARAQLAFDSVVNVSHSSGSDSRQPHMALDDAGTLHVVWTDQTGALGIRYARSFDQGRTFTDATVLSTGAGFAQRPRLAIHGTVMYVVWMQEDRKSTRL